MKRLVYTLICLLGVVSRLDAATYYTAKNGVDSGRICNTATNINTPLLTVAKGLTCLSAGDTLYIRAGTYNERIQNGITNGTSWDNATQVKAYNGETVWLTPSSGNWVLYFGSDAHTTSHDEHYIIVDGINMDGRSTTTGIVVYFDTRGPGTPNHIRVSNAHIIGPRAEDTNTTSAAVLVGGHTCDGYLTDPCGGGLASWNEILNLEIEGTGGPLGVYITGDYNTVNGCNIHDVAGQGVQIYDNDRHRLPIGNTVSNNKIHDIVEAWFFGMHDNRVGGILALGDDHLIFNNIIYRLHLGAGFGTPDPFGGIQTFASGTNRRIENNTIFDVDTSNNAGAIFVASGSSNTIVRNNIMYGVSVYYVNGGSATSFGYNLCGSGCTGTGVVNGNPLFTDSAGGDFTINSSGSPVVDSGFANSVALDYNGLARPTGGGFDMGAFEFSDVSFTSSPDCTYLPGIVGSITDSIGAVWSLGSGTTPNIQILRNGVQPVGALGAQILYYGGDIYVQGDDLLWYLYTGSPTYFLLMGASDPSGSACLGAVPGPKAGIGFNWLVRF